jgi:hypothetical protein
VLVVGCCSKGLPYISTSSEPGVKQIKYEYISRVKFSICHSWFPLHSEFVVARLVIIKKTTRNFLYSISFRAKTIRRKISSVDNWPLFH